MPAAHAIGRELARVVEEETQGVGEPRLALVLSVDAPQVPLEPRHDVLALDVRIGHRDAEIAVRQVEEGPQQVIGRHLGVLRAHRPPDRPLEGLPDEGPEPAHDDLEIRRDRAHVSFSSAARPAVPAPCMRRRRT